MQMLSKEEKLKFVEGIRIIHPQFQKAMRYIEEAHHESSYTTDPLSLLIFGNSGCGKTTLFETYIKKHDQVTNTVVDGIRSTNRVILHASIPSPATHVTVTERLLKQLGDPYPSKGTVGQKDLRLVNLIKSNKVQLIMLDEIQHFIDKDKEKVIHKVSDWFKSLINQTRVPVVLFGLEEAQQVLDANEQLSRRFPVRMNIKPFGFKSPKEIEEFRRLMHEIDQQLCKVFTKPSLLGDEEMCERMFYATNGSIDSIMKLIRRSAKEVIERDGECIDLMDLARAYERYTHVKMDKAVNPFVIEHFSLSKFSA
ncbi:TniB family NTP-binding protein [Paenibacillus cremeus]|uniref:AAA family ATPase n=1 Tax=Paenibacillus cremeus TaxID=2163881 RepID=A0A559KAE2_9BACL|nr:TniB family NTP-binding protein [Paenibacillus cremeus]TVY09094.1 AAA family ATPase [Paenibacillus cremeus]